MSTIPLLNILLFDVIPILMNLFNRFLPVSISLKNNNSPNLPINADLIRLQIQTSFYCCVTNLDQHTKKLNITF